MKTNRAPLVIAASLLIVPAAPALAATFQVLRASDAAQIASAAPIATVVTSPFDDAAARLVDGSNYFYAVLDENGAVLTIAAQRNPVLGGVRVSFDDGNPASAAVDALGSTVTVAPASVRADGLEVALATIIPRDAQGVALGRGLTIVVDAGLLWPGHLASPIEDMGDGSYCARIVSSVPGDGTLDVTVEGIALPSRPGITFTAPDSNLSLRDLAIVRLRDLTAGGGRFASLDGAGHAWSAASRALGELEDGNLLRDDNTLKHELDNTLRQLAPLLETDASGEVRDLMEDVLDIARLIAAFELQTAESACGVCTDGAPRKVCDAMSEMSEADAARDEVNPDWSRVIDGYARAAERALQAEHGC